MRHNITLRWHAQSPRRPRSTVRPWIEQIILLQCTSLRYACTSELIFLIGLNDARLSDSFKRREAT